MVDKYDLGSIGAVLAGGVAAVYSYAVGLGVGTILLSVGIGSLLTFIVQTRTQKTAWKREAALRKVDEIYGPVYNEINRISQALALTSPLTEHSNYSHASIDVGWYSIKSGYQYYLIDEALRGRLGEFYDLLARMETNQGRIFGIVDSKLLRRLRAAFGEDVQTVLYQIAAKLPNGMPITTAGSFLYQPILAGRQPLDFERSQYPNYTEFELELLLQRAGQMKKFFGKDIPNPEAAEKFDKLVAECAKEVAADPTIVQVQEQAQQLKKSADLLLDELKRTIEKPWNV